ncbi:MAG: hypothetical protein JWO93_2847 [Micrococcaceae bacterium]|nr:hypothetical protein [Micrococcaceae bacterium]
MYNNGKPTPPRQVLDVIVIGEAPTNIVTAPNGWSTATRLTQDPPAQGLEHQCRCEC